ncbi:unnamed protein product [Strongylus vulgaris]|uniref:Uncharacterized protein n=1 Tax=Strongylus vulgaris TaxID=40348 RepID=A0A3P7KAF0_STRVU|nr:unnamed protein product [Strongylus vulgaris]
MVVDNDPVSFTGAVDPEESKPSKEADMMELVHKLKREKAGATSGSETGTETSASTGTGKKKSKKKKKRKKKMKRKRDRYESQNFLLRIEGTLCCASLIIATVWIISIFIALIVFLVWAEFSISATITSVKEGK